MLLKLCYFPNFQETVMNRAETIAFAADIVAGASGDCNYRVIVAICSGGESLDITVTEGRALLISISEALDVPRREWTDAVAAALKKIQV